MADLFWEMQPVESNRRPANKYFFIPVLKKIKDTKKFEKLRFVQ